MELLQGIIFGSSVVAVVGFFGVLVAVVFVNNRALSQKIFTFFLHLLILGGLVVIISSIIKDEINVAEKQQTQQIEY